MNQIISFKDRFLNDFRFLREWARTPKSIGSITPTSKIAAKSMAALIPANSTLPILELGSGTGPITRAIQASGVRPERLVCVEYNPDFCRHLRHNFPGINVVEGDAFALETTLAAYGDQKFAAILSGLPLLNFNPQQRISYIENGLKWLNPGAPFIQLCYGPKPPVKAKPGVFYTEPTKWILSNVPPARFWVYRSVLAE